MHFTGHRASGGEGPTNHPFLAIASRNEYNGVQMADEERDEDQARPRPRVVDRRISSRPPGDRAPRAEPTPADPAPDPAPAPTPEAVAPPPQVEATPAPEVEAAPAGEPAEPLWTPEQEAEAQRMVEQISKVSSRDWVADAAIRLANVAGVKLDGGDPAEAQLAIDALAGLLNSVGQHLGEAEAPLRQMLAQLQMAFAQGVPPPPGDG